MCRVAQGHAEAYWEAGIYTWDIAAAELIVRQAGGRTTALKKLSEPHRMSFLATNSHLHDAFKDIIRATA
jgi:fructose-1,6-bisphosphatase/inositol monophosphatase family enzyme